MNNITTRSTGLPDGVIALTATTWRISDPSRAEHDGLSLLGFIEQNNDDFEVTALGAPRQRQHFASFDEAINALHLTAATRSTDSHAVDR
ncbi:MAG: hypothetical protein JWQ19_2615 [Subtercola sp.]|nr:hypothetical protein [Subtercola sp.]